ncbi:MAG TPA: sigma-70 family RNA polymerase sigma factor [Actinomycetota bacterium]|nr:sigma-70 family RNA polymerase sigma factor [Actinomycetota bacterium]
MSDRELVVAFQSGDRDAYTEMYRRYSSRVRRICSRILLNQQDIDEATQETFLKAYQALGRFNGSYQLGAWLARIAANVCVDHVRFRARSANMVTLSPEHELLGAEGGPEEMIVGQNPRVDEAIGELQPLHARALKLRALGGYSHEEMAGELAMTPAQVKALLHRARTSFKRAWEKAEGWAVAPFLGVRNLFSDRSQGGDTVIGAGPAFGPMFAERVATSAVIVVVALTGVPSQAPDAQQEERPAITAPADIDPVAPKNAGKAKRHAALAGVRVTRKAAQPEEEAERRGLVTTLLGESGGTFDPDDGDDGDDGDGGDDGIGAADAGAVVKQVRDLIHELQESIELRPDRN